MVEYQRNLAVQGGGTMNPCTNLKEIVLNEVKKNAIHSNEIMVVCIGNPLRGDDALGPLVAELLQKEGFKDNVINAENTLESFIDEISSRKPKVIIFVDAVDAGLHPGDLVFAEVEKTLKHMVSYSTHAIPLPLLLKVMGNPKGYILGAQAKTLEIGREPSREIKESARKIVDIIKSVLTVLDKP